MHLSTLSLGAAATAATLLFSSCVSSVPTTFDRRSGGSCTKDNAVVRKKWNNMERGERLAFISGIKCIMSLPSQLEPGLVPAAENRFDDYTAVHINQSLSIHLSGTFLSWHREYLHILETEMHEKCDYPTNLGMPYWDWLTDPILDTSPIFDGSDESLGSNGDRDPNPKPIQLTETAFIPHGTGGLCVTKGPFADTKVRFGPFSPLIIGKTNGQPPTNWTVPNRRCLTRDFNTYVSTTHMTAAFLALLQTSPTIADFQDRLTPPALGVTGLGLHRAGHLIIGGPAADFFASPQDPAFFLHHAQIDRLWAEWQLGGGLPVLEGGRRFAYNGTSTMNSPVGVTPEVSNSTVITFGVLGGDVSLEEVADPMAGRYCYRYE